MLAAVAALLLAALPAAAACTSVLVSPAASADGSVLLARTDDTWDARSTVNNLAYHPPRSGPALFRSNANGLALELPAPGAPQRATRAGRRAECMCRAC